MIKGFYKKINGIKIYIEENDAPQDAQVIVCLHTAGRENRQWHEIMEILEGKVKLYTFDMPAHGKSWPLPGNKAVNNYKDYGKWIWDVIQALNVKDPIVAGCSMGGNIVYHMGIEYPVKGIISMQGSDYTPTVNEHILELLNHPYVSCQHSHLEFTESLIGKATSKERREFIMWGVHSEIGLTKQADLTQYNGFDVRDQMSRITCPAMIIQGMDDGIATAQMAENTIKKLVNSPLVTYHPVEDYGHFIIVENPEIVSQYMLEFVHSFLKK